MRNLQPDFIKQLVSSHMVLYPELAEDMELLLDHLEGIGVTDLIDKWVRAIEDTKVLIDGAAARIKEWTERVDRFDRRCQGLREGIRKIMEAADIHKLERPTATLYFVKSQPRVLDITGSNFDLRAHEDLKDDFIVTKREISKSLLAAAMKAGENVEGFELSNAPPSLHIKVK